MRIYNTQPVSGIRKGTKRRPQYTSYSTQPIREELERVLGSKELALNCMDALIRTLDKTNQYLAPKPMLDAKAEREETARFVIFMYGRENAETRVVTRTLCSPEQAKEAVAKVLDTQTNP